MSEEHARSSWQDRVGRYVDLVPRFGREVFRQFVGMGGPGKAAVRI